MQQYLAILLSWVMPPDSPYLTSIWSEGVIKWTSMSAYLPLCSLAGALAYWRARHGDSKKRIVAVCAVCALVPILNSAFYALNSSYYARWYYMPVLILAAMTVNALEDHNTDLDTPARGLGWIMLATLAFALVPVLDNDTGTWSLGVLKNPGQYFVVLGFGLGGLLLYRLICQKWRADSRFAQRMTAAVVAFACVFSMVHIGIGKFGQWYTDSDLVEQDNNALLLKEDLPEGDYRVDTYKIHDNIGMWLDKSCLQYFGSTAAPSILSFYPALGVKRDVRSEPELSNYALRGLLSVEYLITTPEKQTDFENEADDGWEYAFAKDGYAVYGQEAIPIYADEEGTTLKMGTSTDPDYPNDTTVYLCVYEKVRTQASIAVLDYDGNILGIGGGIGEKKVDLGFNRATSPHQTGSTMKPIGAYALALDYKLINYSSQILDSPYYSAEDKKVLKDQYIGVMSPYSEAAQSRSDVWRAWPTNYGGAGGQGNPMLVYDALQQSYNTVAVWVGDMVGVDYLYNFVHDTLECSYISAENDMDLGPLVLGSQSNGLTVVQLAGAYTMFNTGSYTTPHYYTEVTDYQGNMILDNNKYINTTQAISADTAYIMNRMMWNVLHSSKGTAYGKGPDGEMDSVAKTGTTSNYKDYTFAGLTPYYVTAIWWGCDRPTEMDKLGKAGASGKPIQLAWKYLMEDLQADLPVKEFAKGENVVEKRFDTSTGAIVSGGGAVGYYTEDNLPDSSYTVTSEEDPFAALAQAAADAAAGAE